VRLFLVLRYNLKLYQFIKAFHVGRYIGLHETPLRPTISDCVDDSVSYFSNFTVILFSYECQ